MNRREAIVLLAAGLGGTVFGARRLFAGFVASAAGVAPAANVGVPTGYQVEHD